MKLKLVVNEYIGVFYKRDRRGHWRKCWQIGNAGVALDTARFLEKLGHKVEVEEKLLEEGRV